MSNNCKWKTQAGIWLMFSDDKKAVEGFASTFSIKTKVIMLTELQKQVRKDLEAKDEIGRDENGVPLDLVKINSTISELLIKSGKHCVANNEVAIIAVIGDPTEGDVVTAISSKMSSHLKRAFAEAHEGPLPDTAFFLTAGVVLYFKRILYPLKWRWDDAAKYQLGKEVIEYVVSKSN